MTSNPVAKGELLRGRAHIYHILGTLGAGGMGTTYRGYEHQLGPLKPIAIKILHKELAQNDRLMLESFGHEARAMGAFNHPNIVVVLWVDELPDGTPLYVMELLNGETIRQAIKRTGRIELEMAINITIDVLRGLHHAHKHLVIHQDVKPSNVVLHRPIASDSIAKLIDFGVMRTVDDMPTCFAGSFLYAAPEQFTNTNIGPHTDIFAAGGLLYEMLTGEGPFARFGNTIEDALARRDRRPPSLGELAPDAPGRLVALVDSMLSPSPIDRPPSAGRVAEQMALITRDLNRGPRTYLSEPDRPMRRIHLTADTDPEGLDYETLMARAKAGARDPEAVGNSVTTPTAQGDPIEAGSVVVVRDDVGATDRVAAPPGVVTRPERKRSVNDQGTRRGPPRTETQPLAPPPISQRETDPGKPLPPLESDVQRRGQPVYVESLDLPQAVGSEWIPTLGRNPDEPPIYPLGKSEGPRVHSTEPMPIRARDMNVIDPARRRITDAFGGNAPRSAVGDELRRIIDETREKGPRAGRERKRPSMEPMPDARQYSPAGIRLRRLYQSHRLRVGLQLGLSIIVVLAAVLGAVYWLVPSTWVTNAPSQTSKGVP